MKSIIIRSLAVILTIATLVLVVSYPFGLRAYFFDNIPRAWSLSDFKSSILVTSIAIAGLSAMIFLVWPFLKSKKASNIIKKGPFIQRKRHRATFLAAILLSFTVFFTLTGIFFQLYNNDRGWITASYSDSTYKEIELQPIGTVMAENELLGFHYRALFLKFFQWTFFPFAVIMPVLLLMLGNVFLGKNYRLPLAVSWLLLLAFLGFGYLLYG